MFAMQKNVSHAKRRYALIFFIGVVFFLVCCFASNLVRYIVLDNVGFMWYHIGRLCGVCQAH